MFKHTQTIRWRFANELLECVWPFCEVGTLKVKNIFSKFDQIYRVECGTVGMRNFWVRWIRNGWSMPWVSLWRSVWFSYLNTTKNTVISSNFLVWKFCGKAESPDSFGQIVQNYTETAFPQNFHTRKLGEITVFLISETL